MEDIIEINVGAKRLNELLMTKRCARHQQRKGKRAKRSRLKRDIKKELTQEI